MILTTRKAKIICTIGPASQDRDKIAGLIKAGMDVARLNFSHGTHDLHIQNIATIRELSAELKKPIGLLQDLQGPKIRTGKLACGPITLSYGDIFAITTEPFEGTPKMVSTTYPQLAQDLVVGDFVLIDDGLLRLKVVENDGVTIRCEVIHGGLLKDNKGINLPGSKLSVPALTDKDKIDLQLGLKYDLDFIALSFVREASDIFELKDLIKAAGKDTPVIAKIEKPQAIDNLESILDAADGIMIARGDLGVELPAEKVPILQKRITKRANEKNKPVIIATQMLESMTKNPLPTRAETSDVANAIFDDADAVMLSGETAAGDFPIESVTIMSKIIEEVEAVIGFPRQKSSDLADSDQDVIRSLEEKYARLEKPAYLPAAISSLACLAAKETRSKALLVFTTTGNMAAKLSKNRSSCPIIALSPNSKALHRMSLLWGVLPVYQPVEDDIQNLDDIVRLVDHQLVEKGYFAKGDNIVITTGSPARLSGKTNLLKLHIVGDE